MNDLRALTAKDLMTDNVLAVYEGWSIKRLTEFFIKHRISGAPVIASDHKLVGVVSMADIIKFDGLPDKDKAMLVTEHVYMEFIGQMFYTDDVKTMVDHADENCTVNTIMTPSVISVAPDTVLPQIAALMQQRGIHRVFVADNEVIQGVVSSGDILQQVAQLG